MNIKEVEIERATKQITALVNQVARDARDEALEEAEQKLITKAHWMQKMLENGRDVFSAATGSSFDKLYQKRCIIWSRIAMLHKLAYEIYELRKAD